MSTWTSVQSSSLISGNVSYKSKGKNRAVNGREKGDGSTSGVKIERRPRDSNGRWSYANGNTEETTGVDNDAAWPPCTWPEEQVPFRPPPTLPTQNGVSPASLPVGYLPEGEFEPTRPPAIPVIRSRDEQTELSSPPYQQTSFLSQDERWPGQYTGPASGFLHPHGPFGPIPANTGRTIYSQQHRPDFGSR